MSQFQSILQCISPQVKNEEVAESTDELSESEVKEMSEIVEDLLSIQKPDILKRNISNLVKENLLLKKKVKVLESQKDSKTDACLSFQIDCEGVDSVEDCSSTETHIQYNSTEGQVMGEEKPPSPSPTPAKGGSSCFNCGGSHNLADCKEEKDYRRIGKNRREFMNKSGGMNSSRYHVDDPQKFGHLAPGLPSKRLSEALGLRRDHLPPYIYKLREMGYPPGWLKHAEISQSGMALYLEEGRKVETGEEGEVVEASDKMRYDTKKLVSWPGFNTEMPRNYRDESDRYRVRSMAKVYSLKDMKREMRGKEQKGYKKGKMQDVSTDNLQPTDMETDDDANDTVDLTNDNEPGAPGDDSQEEGEIEREVNGDSKIETPIKQQVGSGNVSTTDTGTPIVELHSPFEILPKYANFGKDMTEHIVFENLPDYTGTWDKMSGLIQRIRNRKETEEDDL